MTRTPVTDDHEQTETLSVDVIVPGHDKRGAATPLFVRTRKVLIEREGGHCWLTGLKAADFGLPLEAHHFPVERCFATKWDWARFAGDCKNGMWGQYAQGFDWDSFLHNAVMTRIEATADTPAFMYLQVVDPYVFVDDMTVNGLLLAKQYHTGKDEGIHDLPHPIWVAQKYLVNGYRLSKIEVIHHAQGDE